VDDAQVFLEPFDARRGAAEARRRHAFACRPFVDRADLADIAIDGAGSIARLGHGLDAAFQHATLQFPSRQHAEGVDPLARPQIGAIEHDGNVRVAKLFERQFRHGVGRGGSCGRGLQVDRLSHSVAHFGLHMITVNPPQAAPGTTLPNARFCGPLGREWWAL
jgi:hypothetical protein